MTDMATTAVDGKEPRSRTHALQAALAAAPLVPPAVGVGLGILLDYLAPAGGAVYAALFIAGGVALFAARRRAMLPAAALLLAAVSVGGFLHDGVYRRIESGQIVRYTKDSPTDACVTGIVLTEPLLYRPSFGALDAAMPRTTRTRFVLETTAIETAGGAQAVTGLIRVGVREPLLNVRAGDCIRIVGRLYRPVPPQNPGERDWRLSNRRQGILAGLSCGHAANVTRQPQAAEFAALPRFRRFVSRLLLDDVATADPAGISLLEAMILGQRSEVDRALNDAFVRTGTVHILSVSGSHLAALAGAVWGLAALLGRSRRQSAWIVLASVIAYALLAEPNAPVIRSAITTSMLCVGLMSRRPVRTGNWLAASAIIIFAIRPCDLFDPGFQLSYLTLGGVLYLSAALHRDYRDRFFRQQQAIEALDPHRTGPLTFWQDLRGRSRRFLETLVAISVAAWLVGAPLGLYHFGQTSTWGWLNSILIAPFAGALMLLGFAKIAVSLVSPTLGSLLGPVVGLCAGALDGWVRLLASLPGVSVTLPSPPLWLVAATVAAFGLWTVRHAMAIPWHAVGVSLAGCVVASLFWYWPGSPTGDELRIRVLSVGAGSATVIRFPNGHAMLYDAGRTPPYEMGKSLLAPALAVDRIRRLDTAIVSHPNLDHFSGLLDLQAILPLREVRLSPHFEALARDSGPDRLFLEKLKTRGVPVRELRQGDRLRNTGGVEVEVLWPPPRDASGPLEANDSSLVLRLHHHGRSMLLCGDIERKAQEWLLAHADVRADVLVLPHHGSYKRWTDVFVRAVAPTHVIRSSDRRDAENPAGLRSLMSRYQYYNTADVGAVLVRMRPDGITVTTGITP